MKRTKTWKIGEECVGGIIQAKISGNDYFPSSAVVKIEILDWKTRDLVMSGIFGQLHADRLIEWLHEATTSCHVGKVLEWVKENAWKGAQK